MSKKTLVAIAIFAATSGLALANGGTFTPAPEAPHNNGGFYVGVSAMRDVGHYAAHADNHAHSTVDLGSQGWGGELFAGYGMTFMDRYYAGLEVFGDLNSNKADINTALGTKFSQNWSAGISFMPGIKITDSTLLFARLGWINSAFKWSGDGLVYANKTHNLNGFQAGLGLEAMVTQNVGVRGEWDWSYYGKFKNTLVDTGATVGLFNHPTVDQFKLGIDYHFNMA